jgi:hypothetical protein
MDILDIDKMTPLRRALLGLLGEERLGLLNSVIFENIFKK